MLKFIFTGLLIYLLIKLVIGSGKKEKPAVGSSGTTNGPGGSRPAPSESGELVEDPQCGVYVPKETAVYNSEGTPFCSQECLQAHAQKES